MTAFVKALLLIYEVNGESVILITEQCSLLLDKSIVNQNYNIYNCGYLFKSQTLELSWGHGSSVFLSWTLSRTSSSHDSHEVELCHQLGEKLGLKDREQVQSSHSKTFALCVQS